MKKVGFIGAFDKTDLILYVAKIFAESEKKVLIMDTTTMQRARYIVPCITPSKYYITEYEGIDVAVGFESLEDIKNYLGTSEFNYDYIFVDIDSSEVFYNMDMMKANKNYFITGFDSYSLKKGLEIVGKMQDKILMTKVLFSREMLQEEEDYLNFLSFYFAIQWEKKKIYFPFENGDESKIIENQRTARIRFKELTPEYRDGLYSLAVDIEPSIKPNDVKRILKNI